MQQLTLEHYANSCSKLAAVNAGIQLGSYEPVDLFAYPMTHLLLLEGLRNLMAVVIEGTMGDGAVDWVSGSTTAD